MARYGTRPTLTFGAACSLAGGALSALALEIHSFPILCAGVVCVGVFQAIANYYRYLAADASPEREGQAVAWTLAAGVFAAIIGPALASASSSIFGVQYVGSYCMVSVLAVGSILLICTTVPGSASGATVTSPGEFGRIETQAVPRVADLLRRPLFIAGVGISFSGCFLMALIMAGAPLFLAGPLKAPAATVMVAMQLHMFGMYAPLLVVPVLMKHPGIKGTAVLGISIGAAVAAIGAYDASRPAVLVVLLLAGLSWALTYSAGSALLTKSYSASERRTARGLGELAPVIGLAAGSICAGPLIAGTSWAIVTVTAALPLTVGVGALIITHRPRERRRTSVNA